VTTKLLTSLGNARPKRALPDRERHDSRKQRPPVEEMSKEARGEVNGVIVRSRLVDIIWSQNCDGEVDMIASEATIGVVVLFNSS
jgi:hypothetical protein